ncbi:ATP-binding cassette domain-containing protein [Candidatus Poriferisocius sp.]|uniref:ATP-binding cassette domain-containing protein n=1 Tax=Candidatus Poriferisocius sp. TaxID=3101276 RepID=UPI003B517084
MNGPSSPTVGQVAAQRGKAVTCSANRPAEMDDPEYAWFIESGAVDLFLVETQDGVECSTPQHMLRASAGQLLPGVAPLVDGTSLGLMAKGVPGTVLRRISRSQLGTVDSVELAKQIDAWIADISAMLVRDFRQRPRIDALLESGEASAMRSGTIAARRGVVWATGLLSGEGLFVGLIDLAASRAAPDGAEGALPLTSATWLTVTQEARVTPVSSSELAERGRLLSGLDAFHKVAFSLERLNRQLALVGQANLARAQAISRRDGEQAARHRLFDALRSPGLHTEVDDSGCRSGRAGRRARRSPAGESQVDDSGRRSGRAGRRARRSSAGESQEDDSGLHSVLRVIGRHAGIEFQRPSSPPPEQSAAHSELDRVLNASDARSRKVKLVPQDRWWVGDSGAMLAFRAEDGRPVALMPGALGNYREVDPASRRRRRITAANAGSLRPDAFTFCPVLKPADVGWRDLWDVARTGLGGLLARLAVTGLLGGLIMLLPAVALGFAADEAIPAGDAGLLYGVSLALVAFGVARALLYVLQDMSLMGIEARVSSRMEAAFWDRLLRLPASVRRQYPAGELAARGTTSQNVRDAAHGVIGNGLLSTLFLVPAFVLIAWRDAWLGGLTAAFGFLSLLVTMALGLRQIGPLDRQMKAVQLMAGRLFQLINGIPRMRMHGAESSGFAVWARGYREQKRTELEFDALETHLRAFGAALPPLAAALVILVATLLGPGSLSAGDFIVVFVLFLLYQRAVKRLGESFGALAAVVPAWNQLRPLLAEAAETGAEKDFVEELHGEVVFDKVSFRYETNGPLVLDDVSIRVSKGEFVALVGESGSGKSTLLRLALGLERPFSGSVCFDGRDLQHLDPKSVRRQIGVVPQVVRLHPADLWDNIVGGDERFTSEDAWRAAQLAAVDREIMAMPMGMLTPIGAGATVISGGESQRIQIAHALIRDPRILILDEATSWLDTETQSRILENLSSLTSTRIVVAHRRSTLQHVDRIFVLQQGKVVQEGSLAELAENPGVFQDLMSRQQAG